MALSLLVFVVASAASAAIFVPPPTQNHKPGWPPPAPTLKVSAPVRKAAVEGRQAPVPLQWTYKHQTIAVPDAPSSATIDGILATATAPTDGISAAAAKAAIEADGYKSVRGLVQTADGKWSARAMRGAVEIAVTVGADGSVSAD